MGLGFDELARIDMGTLCDMAAEWAGEAGRIDSVRDATQADIDAFLR